MTPCKVKRPCSIVLFDTFIVSCCILLDIFVKLERHYTACIVCNRLYALLHANVCCSDLSLLLYVRFEQIGNCLRDSALCVCVWQWKMLTLHLCQMDLLGVRSVDQPSDGSITSAHVPQHHNWFMTNQSYVHQRQIKIWGKWMFP